MTDIVGLIESTVRLEQPLRDGQATVGTGFMVTETATDGAPRTILITAHHVFAAMPHDEARVGFRSRDASGNWRYDPISLRIRDAAGAPLWTRHPTQDVAAIELPPGVAPMALPREDLGDARVLETLRVRPGFEMMVLGYPIGAAANREGFPILRSGRVASYPLSPATRYPTYLVDFNVFGGNSGGPVYAADGRGPGRIVVTGLLTQQMEVEGERLAIGNVTQAGFIAETLTLLTGGPAVVEDASGEAPAAEVVAAATAPPLSSADRLRESWRAFNEELEILLRRLWIVIRESVMGWITPDPKPASPGPVQSDRPGPPATRDAAAR
ncbi:serine protease [Phenylobacterium sp.]|uniref:serine protease n=1 Tax=Phenylobacterium sp. TaxID=1871053 RepID=UPI003784CDC0